MQDWMGHHFGLIFPFYFAGLWVAICYFASFLSGWHLLSKRFQTKGEFHGPKRILQSADMRFNSHYNGCLTVGADSSGLFLVPLFIFRLGHPPLLVPWSEILSQRKKRFFGLMDVVELQLGRSEEVPLTINMKLAAWIEAAVGTDWPTGYPKATPSPPRLIG